MWAIIMVGLFSLIIVELFNVVKAGCAFIFVALALFWLLMFCLLF